MLCLTQARLRWNALRKGDEHGKCCFIHGVGLRVQVPNIFVLKVLVIVVEVQILWMYMTYWVLGPFGLEPNWQLVEGLL